MPTVATSCPAPRMAANFIQKTAWVLRLRVRLWVGLNKWLPVLFISVSQLCAFSHACSEASAELGEAE